MKTFELGTLISSTLKIIEEQTKLEIVDIKYSQEVSDITIDFNGMLDENTRNEIVKSLNELELVALASFTDWAVKTLPKSSLNIIL